MQTLPSTIIYKHILPFVPFCGITGDTLREYRFKKKTIKIVSKLFLNRTQIQEIRNSIDRFNFLKMYPFEFASDFVYVTVFFRKIKDDYIVIYL
jgi:hypothetical protein